MRRFVLLLALLALLAWPMSQASVSYRDPRPLGDPQLDAATAGAAWLDLQSLRASIPERLPDRAVGQFVRGRETLLLAGNGRAALVYAGGEGEPDSAWLGRLVPDGEWIILLLAEPAVAPEGLETWLKAERERSEAHRAEMVEWRRMHEQRMRRLLKALESEAEDAFAALGREDPENFSPEHVALLEAMGIEERALAVEEMRKEVDAFDADAPESDVAATDDHERPGPRGVRLRLLPIPHRDGWLLVDESNVAAMAASWNAHANLSFTPTYWNDSLDPEERIEGNWRWMTIKPPLPARLPTAVSSLLLDAPRLVAVSEWLDDPTEPTWKAHEATLRIRVDFGSAAGARPDMSLHGLPPDERWRATISEVDQDSAIANLKLERFSPWDAVELPTRGLRFSTRSSRSESETCGFDSSAAVKANVTEVIGADAIDWDADGFAFLRLRIDQGRSQGLMKGDELSAEDYSFGPGEGRVESVDAQEAVVLWRLQRFHPSMEVDPPKVGLSLVTPAWRRASYDTFGSWDAAGTATKVEGEADAEAAE